MSKQSTEGTQERILARLRAWLADVKDKAARVNELRRIAKQVSKTAALTDADAEALIAEASKSCQR